MHLHGLLYCTKHEEGVLVVQRDLRLAKADCEWRKQPMGKNTSNMIIHSCMMKGRGQEVLWEV